MAFLLYLAIIAVASVAVLGQFPSVCNTPENLETKTCCPSNCNGNGRCKNIYSNAFNQSKFADPDVVQILQQTPNVPEKGAADARYLWPVVVFGFVCVCDGNYWGVDCSECAFGWTGTDCSVRKEPVIRKSFARLSQEEKQTLINATLKLKEDMGRWSVVVKEPQNYSTGTVTLQNVSTYNFFIFLHDYVARNSSCDSANMNMSIDFAHSGPAFPVWHRRYILIVEREFQRITKNDSFGFPYW